MMTSRTRCAVTAILSLLWIAAPSSGSTIPSKVADDPAVVETSLSRDEVGRALAATGLTSEEVGRRLGLLSAEDLERLAENLDQIQDAGGVPKYVWLPLAILTGVILLLLATGFPDTN